MRELRNTEIWQQICVATASSGRDLNDIRIMAVSKGQTQECIKTSIMVGYRLFGENRVQEAMQKFSTIRDQVELHFIGNLQRNKVRKAVQFFDCIQSVDSLRLLDAVGEASEMTAKPLALMLELHTGEESKHGFSDMKDLTTAVESISQSPHLQLQGLMTIAPHTTDTQKVESSFSWVREVRDEFSRRGVGIPHLSMGMSDDFPLAIAHGATLLRLGRAIFGGRNA